MKIYLTEFTFDGLDYTGTHIVAEEKQEAELICASLNCRIVGVLTDVIMANYQLETLH